VPDNGLNEYLGNGGRFETYLLDGEALTVIPTRGGMVHSAELLASSRARSMFQAMRRSNPDNFFICDLPPVFANDDAVATMAYLDAYILVSEEGLTTEREIKDSVETLGRGKLAGVVLNKFKGGVLSDGYGVDSYYAVGYGEPAR
jgi:Mrp family chromosome partitioning ATPase